jgi:hypothetical protein
MRPITTNGNNIGYSTATELNRTTVQRQSDAEPLLKKRKIAEDGTVATAISQLETLLTQHWNPNTQQWDTGANEQQAKRLTQSIGTGYMNATFSLLLQTGQYCAYCDAPVFSDIHAEPILPLKWFPTAAFDYDKLLLACPICRAVLEASTLNRSTGDIPTLTNIAAFAWPQILGQGHQNGDLLPFRYQLVYLPEFNFGDAVAKKIGDDEIHTLLKYYRLGYIQMDYSGLYGRQVIINLPDQTPVQIASLLTPTNFGVPLEKAVENLISLFQLNSKGVLPEAKDGLDSRLAFRTMAHLKALDFFDCLRTIKQDNDPDLFNPLVELWSKTSQATGFWGVWLSVFQNVPEAQPMLANNFQGTFPVTWKVF